MQPGKIHVLLFIGLITVASLAPADEPAIKWVRNLDDAKRIAADEKKDVMITFTGMSWCGFCIRLDREVFSQQEFAAAAKDFVLVELDFPSSDDELEGERKDLYPKWRSQYLVEGFPTVVVTDASGVPCAYTGYNSGITPATFLKRLESYRVARRTRDQALAEAEMLTGPSRAQKLDAAIKAVVPFLGTMYSRKIDPVFAFYGSVVEEIERLDADSGELRKYYDVRKKNRKEWEQNPGAVIFKELERFQPATESPAAIAYIEQILPDVQDDDLRWRLEVTRQTHIGWASMDQHISEAEHKLWYEKGLDNARRLLSVPPKSSKDRVRLLQSESFMLRELHRIDEMVAAYDQLILIAADNPTERLRRLREKATSLMSHGRPEQAIEVLRAYRAATEPKTESWRDATRLLAGVLASDEQRDAAIALHKELLNYYHDSGTTSPGVLISIAESQQAIGAIDEANKSLEQAEKAIMALTTNPDRRQDKQAVQRLNERIAKVRQLIKAGG